MMDVLRDIDIKAIYHFNGDAFEVLSIDERPSKANVIEDLRNFDASYEAILHYRNNVTCRIDSAKCCEGIFYRIEWKKKGALHKDNGVAVCVIKVHYIPEETHLDEAFSENWINGVRTDQVDTTYETIISHKPLLARQYFGWDI